ncbi:MAG: HU family DNA-binding protein [Candidatus Azobacteroides sp.]|nr:HU family DNA-binding protein [Candidatus Azobacteroides sp.]
MSVQYTLFRQKNPAKPEEPMKWFALAKSKSGITLKEMGRNISQSSTVNMVDVVAVLEALKQEIEKHLSEGKIVRMDDFGSFQLTIGSEGVKSEQAFHPGLIRRRRIVFRPGKVLKT